MALFQKSVVNKYLRNLNRTGVDEAYKVFQENFSAARTEQIKQLKEEEYQDGFLRDLFVSVLGYTLKPDTNFNLVRERKNEQDAKKADGAVIKDGNVIAVIELKDTKTKDMGSVTDQAFGYKNSHEGCKFVVTSNFHKLRFYIDNKVDFEEFDLFELNREQFDLLYLILSRESIFSDLPSKLKSETKFHEENISNKLYKDYSVFKKKLYDNMVRNAPGQDRLTLFKKSQKLIDRYLFILFAEDRGLLPPNSISRIISRFDILKAEDAYKPLYDICRQFFGYLNTGNEKEGIPAYNGGLFLPDEVLDSLKIDDDILRDDLYRLSTYDFDTEIDVNILGHIFEHSLSEIEEITAEIEGVRTDKAKSKRKKDGVYYTPKYITQYIVENTIGTLCAEKRKELRISDIQFDEKTYRKANGFLTEKGKTLFNTLEAYKKWLLTLKIVDPACGSGAFLNQALNFLIAEHKTIDDIIAELTASPLRLFDTDKAILENNLYGVDINDESVEIAKLSLWLHTARKDRKLSDLNNNIKCGNSLIDDPAVAGDKAFDWHKQFPDIMQAGGFDVVIGNPPYVFAREKISQEDKLFYNEMYQSAEYQVNTYMLFIEKSINLIKHSGIYGLIVPNSWLMVSSATKLRKYILDNSRIEEIINLSGYSFENVNVETIILVAKKDSVKDNEIKILTNDEKENFNLLYNRNQEDFLNNTNYVFKVYADDLSTQITEKIVQNTKILDDLTLIKAGLKAYEKTKGTPPQSAQDVLTRPFDYLHKFDDQTYPYLEGKDVKRYSISWAGLYLKYGSHLAAPRTFDIFEGEKIIIREITGHYPKSIIATYTKDIYLFNMSNIAILKKDENIDLKYILSLLNSSVLSFYFLKNTAKSVRKMFPKIILNDLRLFPIKEISYDDQRPFIEKVDKMLELSRQLQEKANKYHSRIKSNFALEKISSKLESFYDHDFKTFVAELKKQKISLTLKQQDEWEEYFNEYKKEINDLQAEIEKTDKEIDRMVYDLYGLTEEEIKVVEGK